MTYLLFDATGTQVEAGEATAVDDGLWEVVLSADTTGALEEGSNRLEIVVVSNLVALPSLGEYQFVHQTPQCRIRESRHHRRTWLRCVLRLDSLAPDCA